MGIGEQNVWNQGGNAGNWGGGGWGKSRWEAAYRSGNYEVSFQLSIFDKDDVIGFSLTLMGFYFVKVIESQRKTKRKWNEYVIKLVIYVKYHFLKYWYIVNSSKVFSMQTI